MFHAGTSNGHVNNKPVATCDAPTIFNRMQKNKNLSWKVYASTPKKANSPNPKDDTPLNALTQDGNYYSLTRLMMSKLHDKELTPHFQPIDQFFQDAQKKNGLPNYAFLEPRFSGRGQNDQHPPSDIRAGEQLIAKVYEAIRNSPQWEETLLVITYDEHGGCYDHVPPPAHAKPPDKSAGQDGFTFTRFGVRVPTVLISPYIEAGTICRPAGWTPFDHTSVIATVQKCFDLDALESERVKAAPDLSCVLNLTHHRTDVFRTVDALYDRNTAKSLFNDLNKYDCTKAEVLFTDLHKLIEDAMTEISELLTTKS